MYSRKLFFLTVCLFFLLSQRFPFEVVASKFEENLNSSDFPSPAEFVIETAKRKALEVRESLHKEDVGICCSLF